MLKIVSFILGSLENWKNFDNVLVNAYLKYPKQYFQIWSANESAHLSINVRNAKILQIELEKYCASVATLSI